MTPPQERPVAWLPKFGERVEGIYASPRNPQRVGMFVRSGVTPKGRMNAGPWWELTDGEGNFWRYRPEACRPVVPQERPVAGDAEALHDAKRRCYDADCACQGAPWPQGPVAGDGLDREAVRRHIPDADLFRRAAVAARNVQRQRPLAASDVAWFDWVPALLDRLAADVPALLAALKAAEAENERHRKANLVRAVVRYAEGHDLGGWVGELINAEDFDPVPWRVAQTAIEKAREAEAEVGRLRAFLKHLADLPIADGQHYAPTCGCAVHQAARFLRTEGGAS